MLPKLSIFIAGSIFALSTIAADITVEKTLPLKDGSTVYVFKDGKMGMEDAYGRSTAMKAGQIMEAKDGTKLVMIGNEVYRVTSIRTPVSND